MPTEYLPNYAGASASTTKASAEVIVPPDLDIELMKLVLRCPDQHTFETEAIKVKALLTANAEVINFVLTAKDGYYIKHKPVASK